MRVSIRPVGTIAQTMATVDYVPRDGLGVWRGATGLITVNGSDWQKIDTGDYTLTWKHYNDQGQFDGATVDASLGDFFATYGNGRGARMGFLTGCDGNDFWLDGLTVFKGKKKSVYDFEGYASQTSLRHGAKAPKKVIIIAGAELKLGAQLAAAYKNKPLAGDVLVEGRDLSKKKFGTVLSAKVGSTGKKSFSVSPVSSRVYRASYGGNADFDPSRSQNLKVLVRTNVRPHLMRKSVRVGRSFTIVGRFWPGHMAVLQLQRFNGHKWNTVRGFRSGTDGSFQISTRSRQVGKSYWRIVVPEGHGNIQGRSPAMKLTTKPKPRPPHHGGGGTPTPTPTNPEPPTNDPVQPPPPTGPQ